eukprot:scaffold29634_cov171-Amphora_coffeaeformis.AAC.3
MATQDTTFTVRDVAFDTTAISGYNKAQHNDLTDDILNKVRNLKFHCQAHERFASHDLQPQCHEE